MIKVIVNENVSFIDHACGIRLLDGCKLAIIQKKTMTSQFPDMTSSSDFFDVAVFLLSSLVTGPSFMSITGLVLELWQFLFIKDWPESEIGNTPVWAWANIWKLGRVRETKFSTIVSNKSLLNAAKLHGYSFYSFWVIKGKLTGGRGVKLPPPPLRLGLILPWCADI